MLKYVPPQVPRYPGTPAPSWPGTFLLWACSAPSLGFLLGSQVVQAATDKVHLTSPRRSTRNSQVRPPHGPPPAQHVRVAQIIHDQAKARQGKDGTTGMNFQSALALHGATALSGTSSRKRKEKIN